MSSEDVIILPIVMLSITCIIPIGAIYRILKERYFLPVIRGEIVHDEVGV